MILELEGVEQNLEQGIQWLKGKGIEVELAEGDIVE
jgi:hypothetical protein